LIQKPIRKIVKLDFTYAIAVMLEDGKDVIGGLPR
jgi:hypothetical protein